MKILHLLLACHVFFAVSCFLLPAPASAQITFQKTFGGNGTNGSSVQQTTDGGYIITGTTYYFGAGNFDIYLIKTDAYGDSLWTKTFGGTSADYGQSVQQTADGGYIIAGSSEVFGASLDVYLIKTDANGNSLWTKTFGGTSADYGQSVQQTTDGGYVIAGSTSSFGAGDYDVYLIRTDVNGDSLWTKTFGGTGPDYGQSIQQTMDGGNIIAGSAESFGAGFSNVYLIKTDTNGNLLWTKTFGGTIGEDGFSVQQTADGGYSVAGTAASFGAGNSDVYLIKTDANGNSLWTKTFGGTDYDVGYSARQTTDGGYIIAGHSQGFGAGLNNIYLIRTDTSGNLLWTKTFGGTNSEESSSVQQTADGGYIITGITNSFGAGNDGVYLIKTDANGNSGCNQGNTATIVTTPATQVSNPATIVFAGGIVTTPVPIVGSGGAFSTLCTSVGILPVSDFQHPISISPNPSAGNFIITFADIINKGEVEIFNAYGAKVFNENISHTSNSVINLKDIPEGIYIAKVMDEEKQYCRKIVIARD